MKKQKTDTQQLSLPWDLPAQDEPLTEDVYLEMQPGLFPGSQIASIILAVAPIAQGDLDALALEWIEKEQITYIGPPGLPAQHPILTMQGYPIRGCERLVYRCIASGVVAGQVRLVFEFVRVMGDLKRNGWLEDEDLGDYR